MIYWCPALHCKNPDCPFRETLPIFLPCPIRLETTVSRPDWPRPDWKAFVACRQCGHLYEYTERDIQWGASQELGLWGQNQFVRAELECEQEGCEFPVVVHMFCEKDIPHATLDQKLFESSKQATCSAGHRPSDPLYIKRVVGLGDL
jgi:hypothetical protein